MTNGPQRLSALLIVSVATLFLIYKYYPSIDSMSAGVLQFQMAYEWSNCSALCFSEEKPIFVSFVQLTPGLYVVPGYSVLDGSTQVFADVAMREWTNWTNCVGLDAASAFRLVSFQRCSASNEAPVFLVRAILPGQGRSTHSLSTSTAASNSTPASLSASSVDYFLLAFSAIVHANYHIVNASTSLCNLPPQLTNVVKFPFALPKHVIDDSSVFQLHTQTGGRKVVAGRVAFMTQVLARSHFLRCNTADAAEYRRTSGQPKASEAKRTKFRTGLQNMFRFAEQLGVDAVISNGILLGWRRECDLIAHTEDLDFFFFHRQFSYQLYEQVLRDTGTYDTSTRRTPLELFYQYNVFYSGLELSFYSNGVKLDAFFNYDVGSKETASLSVTNGTVIGFAVPPKCLRVFINYRSTFRRLCASELLESLVYLPCDVDSVIVDEYGEQWRVPIVKYDWTGASGPLTKRTVSLQLNASECRRSVLKRSSIMANFV